MTVERRNGVLGKTMKTLNGESEYFVPLDDENSPTANRRRDMATLISDRRCELCRFSFKEDGGGWTCRYGPPPSVIPMNTPQGIGFAAPAPPVDPKFFCHKFERGILQ